MKFSQRKRGLAAATTAVVLGTTLAAPASAATAEPPPDWPEFGYQGVITDKDEMQYNPTNEFIFPSVFHAGEYLDDPLGEWYLYLAPHDAPAGVMLMYADSLEGPWTEYGSNPIIESEWEPHYDVSHVSSPDAIWNEETDSVYLYFHGENTTTRWASSDDGVNFEYGDIAVTTQMTSATTTESSYGRVFRHPDPESGNNYGMFYMANETDNRRKIRLAESPDGIEWTVAPDYVVYPGEEEGANVSAANLWEWNGQNYVVYHASSGKSYARTIDPTLREVGETPILLHEASGLGDDVGRVASPEIVTDNGDTYLFYESGDRLGATIAWAKDGADVVLPPPFGDFPEDPNNPVFEQCAAEGSDEFASALSDDVWDRVIREADARHTVNNGALTIPTYAGGVSAAPLLQQELPDGPWQVTTKVTIDPTQKYQQAGLLLYATDSHYAKLDTGVATPGRTVELVYHRNGGNRQDSSAPKVDQPEMWLRYTSDGDDIRASVSYDGSTFERYGRDISVADAGFTHVGPYAFRGGAETPEVDASFGWFRFSPSQDEYEACMNPALPDDDETHAPGAGVLSSTSGWTHGLADGNFDVQWNMWWGANASRVELYEDGQKIATQELTAAGPEAQRAVFPITGRVNGEYEYVLKATNSQGTTTSAPLMVTITDAAPATPSLSHNNRDRDGDYTVTADLWWGTNATSWSLTEDGVAIAHGDLAAETPAAQSVEVPVSGRTAGEYTYIVTFSNDAGDSHSRPLTVTVAQK